jgi:hypothetical protein
MYDEKELLQRINELESENNYLKERLHIRELTDIELADMEEQYKEYYAQFY